MTLEIREIVVKVNVEDDRAKPGARLTQLEKKKLIEECTREVLKKIKNKRRR